MKIQNFSQLKKALSKKPFEIVEHYIKPELTGQKRVAQKVQTNALYTGVLDDPEHYVSKANGGMGYRMDFGKASDWTFDGDLCKQVYRGRPIWTIRVLG